MATSLPTSQMARKIYFAGSISGGREYVEVCGKIILPLKKYGTVLTEHVANPKLDSKGEKGVTPEYIHNRDIEWLEQSDVLVAEVTQPSLGVGYEIGRAVHMRKKILCLYRPTPGKRLSAMIRGAADGDNFQVKDYSEDQIEAVLKEFFGE